MFTTTVVAAGLGAAIRFVSPDRGHRIQTPSLVGRSVPNLSPKALAERLSGYFGSTSYLSCGALLIVWIGIFRCACAILSGMREIHWFSEMSI
jgi:hypothetical protein